MLCQVGVRVLSVYHNPPVGLPFRKVIVLRLTYNIHKITPTVSIFVIYG
jgi:hypothetical protein